MNDLQQSLLDAMEILADAAEKNSKRTKTIECTITDNSQAGAGIYQANYLGNVIQVYSGNLTSSYAIGEVVNVLVPEGDFTKDKTIIGSVRSGANLINTSAVSSGQSYVSAGSNLLKELASEEYLVTTWKQIPNTETGEYIYKIDLDKSFTNKIKNYRSTGLNRFKLTASVKSNIDGSNNHTSVKGDYGITIYLPRLATESEPHPAPVAIDLSTGFGIDGVVDKILTYTSKSSVTPIDSSIVLDPDEPGWIELWARGYYIPQPIDPLIYDVSFKDLSLEPVSQVNNNEYTLILGGDLEVNSGEQWAEPTAKLMYQGVEVEAERYYWFIYNVNGDNNNLPETVKRYVNNDYDYIEDTKGNSLGGFAWFLQNPATTVYHNNNSIRIPKQKFWISANIKCVAIYGNTPYTAECIVTNEERVQNCDFTIKTETGMSAFPNKGKINLITTLTDTSISTEENPNLLSYGAAGIQYIFAYYSTKGVEDKLNTIINNGDSTYFTRNYINKQENNSLISSVGIKAEDIDGGYCVIKCSAFYINQEDETYPVSQSTARPPILIKTVTIPINISEDLTYNIIAENANTIYKYDKDGDSPTSGSAYNSNTPVDNIKPISIRVYNKNGSEISENQYDNLEVKYRVSKNNLYKELYVLSSDGKKTLQGSDYLELTAKGQEARKLYYTIQDKYSAANNENEIEITATYDNNVFKLAAPIMFLKEGENGVNATKYIGYICVDENNGNVQEDYSYEQKDNNGNLHKLVICKNGNDDYYYILHNNDTWKRLSNSIKFELKVYQNGSTYVGKIKNISWKCLKNETKTEFENSSSVLILTADQLKGNVNKILCVEYTINDLTLTSYYSLDYITVEPAIDNLKGKPAFSYDYGFNNVLYDADGGSPSYNSSLLPKINLGYNNDYTLYDEVLIERKDDSTLPEPFKFDCGEKINKKDRIFTPESKMKDKACASYTQIQINFSHKNDYFTRYDNDKGGSTYYNEISPEFNYNTIDTMWEQYYKDAIKCFQYKTSHDINVEDLKNYITSQTPPLFPAPQEGADKLNAEFYATIQVLLTNTPTNYTLNYIFETIFASKFILQQTEAETIETKYTKELIDNYRQSTDNAGSEYIKLTNFRNFWQTQYSIYDGKTITFSKPVILSYNQHDLGSVDGYNGNQPVQDFNTVSAGTGDTETGIYLGRSNDSNILSGYRKGKKTFCLDGDHGTLMVASEPDFEVNQDYIKMGEIGVCEGGGYGTIIGCIGSTGGGGGGGSDPVDEEECYIYSKDSSGLYQPFHNFSLTLGDDKVTEYPGNELIRPGEHNELAYLTYIVIGDVRYEQSVYLSLSSGKNLKRSDMLTFGRFSGDESSGSDNGNNDEGDIPSKIYNGAVGFCSNGSSSTDHLWAGYANKISAFTVRTNKINFFYDYTKQSQKAYIDENGNFISGNCRLEASGLPDNSPALTAGYIVVKEHGSEETKLVKTEDFDKTSYLALP